MILLLSALPLSRQTISFGPLWFVIMGEWSSGLSARLLCEISMVWGGPSTIVEMLAHCPPNSKCVPLGDTGGDRYWPPYLTILAAQDERPL